MDLFQGQRAGRELCNEKSRYVQEIDLQIFREDVAELKAYIADVVPKSEVAREIFAEIDAIFRKHYEMCSRTDLKLLEPIQQGERFVINEMWNEFAELKKKYTA